ncbi:MAG: hypothetical protein EZS28_045565 [Streblomastix strix]|uniref:Uncharacterized protein n=1 Tax=Streblomastix strix TaxID=222440 RepID=A0A5J4TL05_9EUKA|nr:MAG: hypothetical protein EZS28_045565 [Streblomastix strix]
MGWQLRKTKKKGQEKIDKSGFTTGDQAEKQTKYVVFKCFVGEKRASKTNSPQTNVFLGFVNASSDSSVALNSKSKLLAFSYNQRNYQSAEILGISGKFLPQVVNYIFQQHRFSKQEVPLTSLENNSTKSLT